MERNSDDPEAGRVAARDLSAALTVADLDVSLAWYVDVLGFVIEKRFERDGRVASVRLRAGEVLILINQDDGSRGSKRVKGEGISLQLVVAGDIDQIAGRIQSAAGTLDTPPIDTPWGGRIFRSRDPDGFRWTFSRASD